MGFMNFQGLLIKVTKPTCKRKKRVNEPTRFKTSKMITHSKLTSLVYEFQFGPVNTNNLYWHIIFTYIATYSRIPSIIQKIFSITRTHINALLNSNISYNSIAFYVRLVYYWLNTWVVSHISVQCKEHIWNRAQWGSSNTLRSVTGCVLACFTLTHVNVIIFRQAFLDVDLRYGLKLRQMHDPIKQLRLLLWEDCLTISIWCATVATEKRTPDQYGGNAHRRSLATLACLRQTNTVGGAQYCCVFLLPPPPLTHTIPQTSLCTEEGRVVLYKEEV